MYKQTKFETKLFFQTVACVVKALEGKYTTIDLRNESCLTGKVTSVDAFMNVDMEDVIFYDAKGGQHVFDTFFVRKRMIRYVHIPKELDVREGVEEVFNSMKLKKVPKKKRTFKESRAQRYQKEIVASLQTNQE